MKATPVPVVSSRYLFVVAPPNTIVSFSPASRATLVNENSGGAVMQRTAVAQTMSPSRRGMRLPIGNAEVGCEADRLGEFGARIRRRPRASQRERKLIMGLRVVGGQAHRVAEFRD